MVRFIDIIQCFFYDSCNYPFFLYFYISIPSKLFFVIYYVPILYLFFLFLVLLNHCSLLYFDIYSFCFKSSQFTFISHYYSFPQSPCCSLFSFFPQFIHLNLTENYSFMFFFICSSVSFVFKPVLVILL